MEGLLYSKCSINTPHHRAHLASSLFLFPYPQSIPKCFRFFLNTLWPLLSLGWCSSPFPHHSSPVILQQCISQLQPSFLTPRGLFPDVAAHWISLAIVYSIRFLGPLRPIKLALKKTGSQKVLILKSPLPQVILMIESCGGHNCERSKYTGLLCICHCSSRLPFLSSFFSQTSSLPTAPSAQHKIKDSLLWPLLCLLGWVLKSSL